MSTARILVVDDEPVNLEIVAEYFADEEGVEVVTAEDGETAWQVLCESVAAFDLILLDRMMPGLDGIGFLRRVKETARYADVPVIFQTAADSPQQIAEGLLAGAYYYLTKPYRRDALLAIVQAALSDARNRYRLYRQLHDHVNSLQFLERGEFSVRTVAEAGMLAAFIAQACPVPDAAVLGISELLINGVEHGNLGISYQEKARLKLDDTWQSEIDRRSELSENLDKRVTLSFSRVPGLITLRIADQGKGFDWQRYLELDPERAFDPNGRGIALARLMSFTSLNYEQGGTVAIVTIQTSEAAATPGSQT